MVGPKKTGAKAPKKTKETPFFRPFSGLARKAKQEAEAGREPAPKRPPERPAAPEQKAEPPRGMSASDGDTFAIYMAGVDALPRGKNRIPATAASVERSAPPPAPAEDPDEGARAALRGLVTDAIRFDVVDDGERLEGRRLDVDPREVRRLRHGRYAVDARLDLHGLTLGEARARVAEFVRKRAQGGDRAVLVVHGKGRHSPGGQPVLRGEVGAWLTDGPLARHVLAFSSAPDEDGGSGAVLVLLAR